MQTKTHQRKARTHHRAKPVIDISKGVIYKSAAEAAQGLSISYSHLVNQLNGMLPNKTNLKYAQ